MKDMLLLDTRPLARRSPLAVSVLLHAAALLALATLYPGDHSYESPAVVSHRHQSVVLLDFRESRPVRRTSGAAPGLEQAAGGRGAMSALRAPAPPAPDRSSSTDSASNGAPGPAAELPHRAFDVSTALTPRLVKQTIVQFDVPPDIVLKQNIPLPNIVSLTTQAPPFRKQFVALSVKNVPVKMAQNVSPAPDILLPNREPVVSDLKVSSALVSNLPKLFRPPATTSPVRIANPKSVNEVPQIAPANTNLAEATAIIALTDSPTQPKGMVVVPPANQAAASGNGGSSDRPSAGGNGEASGGHGSQPSGSGDRADAGRGVGNGKATGATGASGSSGGAATASNGAGSGEAAAANGAGRGTGNGFGNAAGAGNHASGSDSGLGASSSNTGAGRGVSGAGSGASGDGLDASAAPAGVTRIVLPKAGKFGVVVIGSSQAVPYPETVGALGGKMVYTVYLSVGLHKKWILQYCLSKEAERIVPRGSATPIDAPWPYLIFRPDTLAGSGDYIMVHGMISPEGRFDQLAMVFPEQLEQKDLLMNSLKLWTFRPASRDRVPVTVEFLLIIPSES